MNEVSAMNEETRPNGRKSQYWDKSVVFKACRELKAQAIHATIRTIRTHTGISGGSDATVQKYINEWRDEEEYSVDPASMPPALKTSLELLWENALLAAQETVVDQQRAVEEDRRSLRAERLELHATLERNESEVENKAHKVLELQKSLQESESTIAQQIDAMSSLAGDKQKLEIQMAQLRGELLEAEATIKGLKDELQRSSAEAQENRIMLKSFKNEMKDEMSELLRQQREDLIAEFKSQQKGDSKDSDEAYS